MELGPKRQPKKTSIKKMGNVEMMGEGEEDTAYGEGESRQGRGKRCDEGR